MRGSHLSLLKKWKPHLSPSVSQDQTLVLDGLAFLAFFRRIRNVIITRSWSLPIRLLQESSLSYGCSLLVGSASPPRCYQSGFDVSHLGCAMSIFWIVCEGQGCLSVLGFKVCKPSLICFDIAVGSIYLSPVCLCIPT